MAAVTPAAVAAFRAQGYVVIPGVLDDRRLAAGRELAAAMLSAEPPPPPGGTLARCSRPGNGIGSVTP
jgi:hypothetical protein